MEGLFETLCSAVMIGVMIAIPMGPVSALCVRYSLKQSFVAGALVGIGAASGDVIYAIIATISIDAINEYMASAEYLFQTIGGVFLLFLSLHAIIKERKFDIYTEGRRTNNKDSKQYILFISFLTTVFSPMTVMLFISMFSAVELDLESTSSYFIVPIGVFIGTVSWLSAMAIALQYIRHRVTDKAIYYINLLSNLFIAVFSLSAIYRGMFT